MKPIKHAFAAALAIITISPVAVFAHDGAIYRSPALGNGAPASATSRMVTVSSATKYVNVNQGDIVQFAIDGQTFDWQFDTLRGDTSFELSAIAPKGVDARGVRVFVAPNPLYRN